MKYLNDVVERELILYKSDEDYDKLLETIWIGCGWEDIQCEQLALLIDSKGWACIKIGYYDELVVISETIELEGFRTCIR
jgi:hypothetical protein